MPDQNHVVTIDGESFKRNQDVESVPSDCVIGSPDGRIIVVAAAVERVAHKAVRDTREGVRGPPEVTRVSVTWVLLDIISEHN